ncbi:hypothetical protein C8J56DRAFT_855997 [Mycena floridula]|nr:hypothetical protein C8J56DRAFT_855997 [Mycena floridula]
MASSELSSLKCRHCGNQYIHDVPVYPVQQFPRLSTSDHVPLAAQIPAIQADIETRETEIRALQNQIDLLKNSLERLQSRMDAAQSSLNVHKGIIHPVRMVPVELLRKIFRECTHNVDCTSSWKASESPWNVTQVCRRWREISTSFPALWSNIGLSNGKPSGETLTLVLQRSGPCLLDINLVQRRKDTSVIEQILFPSSPRWRNLVVNLSKFSTLNKIQGRIAALEDLHVIFSSYSQGGRIYTMFKLAPALRRVHVEHVQNSRMREDFDLPCLILPLATISQYTLKADHNQIPLELDALDLCQSLTKVSLRGLPNVDEEISFTLPILRDLTLTAFEGDAIASLLNNLTAPALTSLRLNSTGQIDLGWTGADQQSLGALIQRSQCPITSLDLMNIEEASQSLLDLFSNTSSITHLVIHACDEALISHLKYRPGRPIVLPNLTHLAVMTQQSGSTLDVVQSRFPPPVAGCARLVEMKVFHTEKRISAAQQTRIDQWRAAGLSIDVEIAEAMPVLALAF